MSFTWWQLPGPGRFVSAIEHALRDGRNTVVLYPSGFPDGFGRALRSRIEAARLGLSWTTLDVRRIGRAKPLDVLFDRFVHDSDVDDDRTAHGLAAEPSLASQIVFVDGLDERTWPVWRGFVADYAAACHARAAGDRALFVVLAPVAQDEAPATSLTLSCMTWSGWVEPLDMQLYAATLLADSALDRLRRDTAVMAIASLALWDPEVADRLALQAPELLFTPVDLLTELAAERAWNSAGGAGAWLDGSRDTFDGKERIHSALLAAAGDRRGIERRIWRGQIGVLFPYLEEQRLTLVAELGRELKVPYQPDPERKPNELILDVTDLELTHICAQLKNKGPAREADYARSYRLKRVRDDLAHLRPVPYERLSHVV